MSVKKEDRSHYKKDVRTGSASAATALGAAPCYSGRLFRHHDARLWFFEVERLQINWFPAFDCLLLAVPCLWNLAFPLPAHP